MARRIDGLALWSTHQWLLREQTAPFQAVRLTLPARPLLPPFAPAQRPIGPRPLLSPHRPALPAPGQAGTGGVPQAWPSDQVIESWRSVLRPPLAGPLWQTRRLVLVK